MFDTEQTAQKDLGYAIGILEQGEKYMTMFEMIVILVLLGFGLWFTNTYIPLQPNKKRTFSAIIVIIAAFFLLNAFGILGSVARFRLVN